MSSHFATASCGHIFYCKSFSKQIELVSAALMLSLTAFYVSFCSCISVCFPSFVKRIWTFALRILLPLYCFNNWFPDVVQ